MQERRKELGKKSFAFENKVHNQISEDGTKKNKLGYF